MKNSTKHLSSDSQLLRRVEVRPLTSEERPYWHELMGRHHYLGDCKGSGEQILYVATIGQTWIGLIGWGSAAFKSKPRDSWIGWDDPLKNRRLKFIANNFRFLLLPEYHLKNMASRVLSMNLKRLSQDWRDAYGHEILLAETFVDQEKFHGSSYLACGWIVKGETKGWGRSPDKTYKYHGQIKTIFVKTLQRNSISLLSNPNLQLFSKEILMDVNWSKIPLREKGGLFETLKKIKDPRKKRGRRYPIGLILAVSVCATLSGAKSFDEISDWGKKLTRAQLRRFGAWRDGPPSSATIRRVLLMIDAEAFDIEIYDWLIQNNIVAGKALAIDGKTLRGSRTREQKGVHLLSTVIHQDGVVLAQKNVGEKTNEIPVAKEMLKQLPLKGCVVTADALHTQTDLATAIVMEHEADYLFTVKENQPTLRNALKSLNYEAFSP